MIVWVLQILALIIVELLYFKIAERLNIVDRPKRRSSHKFVTLRGGGFIFSFSIVLYCLFNGPTNALFLIGMALIAGVSFADDVRSLPIRIRLFIHFVSSALLLFEAFEITSDYLWMLLIGITVIAGLFNIFNFMDGINGITGAYAISVLIPLIYINSSVHFVSQRLLITVVLSVIVFLYFNFRPIARCFAGDVGSMSIAYILLFCIAKLIAATGDYKYVLLIAVYCVDGVLTIFHRLMLREDITQPHRKHAYQIMANELRFPHRVVALLYATVQLIVSFGLIAWNGLGWIYPALCVVSLMTAYAIFIRKFSPLHNQS